MAGKHTAIATVVVGEGFEFNPKADRAYAEGRAGSAAKPPVTDLLIAAAWQKGDDLKANQADQYETATVGTIAPSVLNIPQLADWMRSEGWDVPLVLPQQMTISSGAAVFLLTRAALQGCDFSQAQAGPMRVDVRQGVRQQGFCL